MHILTIDQHLTELKQPSKLVTFNEQSSIKTLIPQMIELMTHHGGVGLAAPQCGDFRRFFIYRSSTTHIEVVINPNIIKYSNDLIETTEGCLSCPDQFVNVKRHAKIKVVYMNERWMTQTKTLKDQNAIIFQHEFDHLNGILLTDQLI